MPNDTPPSDRKKVLVADDNRVMVDVIRFNIEASGLSATVARDGEEAWKFLQDGEFDFVVTDYQMPGLNGEELCRLMRQDPRLAEIPIVLLSAKGLELDAKRLREEFRVHDVMFKPFSPRQLVQTIQERLSEELAAN